MAIVPASRTLTARDEAILRTLGEKVRCLSLGQLGNHWWRECSRPRERARTRVQELEALGWAEVHKVFARCLPELTAPIAIWRRGDATPDFATISHFLKTRFQAPATTTTVVVASRQTGKRFGCPAGRAPRPPEASHDLGLASVFLGYLQNAPVRAAAWISESRLIRAGEGRASKLADALIRMPSGEEIVIEFGGEYSKQKLLAFHQDCVERDRSYELW